MGEKYGVGRNTVRSILHHIGILGQEGRHGRYRLPREFVQRGYGHRIDGKGRKHPFDVLSPLAQQLIDEQWEQARIEVEEERTSSPHMAAAASALADFKKVRLRDLEPEQEVSWLLYHFPSLTLTDVATILSVSRPLVSRYSEKRAKQRERLKARRERGEVINPWRASINLINRLIGEPDIDRD